MTRIGFYIIENFRYKLVQTIEVPWDFTLNAEDGSIPSVDEIIIGSGEYPEVDEHGHPINQPIEGESGNEGENTGDSADGSGNNSTESDGNEGGNGEDVTPPIEEEPATNAFPQWFVKYFYTTLIKDDKFFQVFNKNRVYFVIPQENDEVIGLMLLKKGRTFLNFEEYDYRKLINTAFPNIRDAMIKPDTEFGGFDDDKGYEFDESNIDTSFGGFDGDEGLQ